MAGRDAEEAELLTRSMRIKESALGDEFGDANGERRRASLEEQIQINMEKSAQRRESLRMVRLRKKRESNPPAEVRPNSAQEAEEVCACERVQANSTLAAGTAVVHCCCPFLLQHC